MKQKLQQIITLATELLQQDGTSVNAPLTLEVGKRYVTRDGRVTSPMELNSMKMFPYCATVDGKMQAWKASGAYDIAEDIDLDLVSLYEEPGIPNPEPDTPTLKLEPGKRYRLRDGEFATVQHVQAPDTYTITGILESDVSAPIFWTSSGHYLANKTDHSWDIVAEEPATPAPPVNPPLTLEVGKRYVNRRGDVVGPLIGSTYDKRYPFTDGTNNWTHSGRWIILYTDPRDLVKEYVPNITVSFTLPPELVLAHHTDATGTH